MINPGFACFLKNKKKQKQNSLPCTLSRLLQMPLQAVPPGQKADDVVGRPIMHLSAMKQATGEAVYCDDIPCYENELHLALVTSTKAYARIK